MISFEQYTRDSYAVDLSPYFSPSFNCPVLDYKISSVEPVVEDEEELLQLSPDSSVASI